MVNPTKISAPGAELIKSYEGCRERVYRCPAGVLTVGYGHTGPDVREGAVWTRAQMDAAFVRDIARFEDGVARILTGALTTQNQFNAMVSLAYNIGLTAFGKSSVAREHRAGQHAKAAAAFALWNKAGGRVLPGLARRRAAEAALYAR